MPSLTESPPNTYIKLMLIGDSGSGKTGSLAPLAKAGYNLRIVDMDGGLRPLAKILEDDADALARISYITFRDKYRNGPQGTEVVRPARAYLQATKALDKWPDDESKPSEWGDKHIFVVDSLTLLSKAAFNQAISLNPNCKDPRQWFAAAQSAIEMFLACVTDPEFNTNVIVISHITDIELNDGTVRGFPTAVGKALSRSIARYFNDLFICETMGQGNNVKRVIRSVPNGHVDAKTSSLKLPATLPIATGMADIFKELSK